MADPTTETTQTPDETRPAKPDAPADWSKRLEDALERLATSQMDESARRLHEMNRRLESLTEERERLLAGAREWETRYRDTRLRQLLTDAAVQGGAYRPDQVVSLLSHRVEWSADGRDPVLVLDDPEGRPVRYESRRFTEAVRSYLNENPNLAASGAGGGAGSKPSAPAPAPRGSMNLADLRRLRPQLEEEARRMR